MAAALAATMQYIKSEEEAAIMATGGLATMPGQAAAVGNNPQMNFKPWGMSGRQTQMQMRNLMQLRVLRTVR